MKRRDSLDALRRKDRDYSTAEIQKLVNLVSPLAIAPTYIGSADRTRLADAGFEVPRRDRS